MTILQGERAGLTKGSYTYVKSTGGGGGTSYQIQMDGGALGDITAHSPRHHAPCTTIV